PGHTVQLMNELVLDRRIERYTLPFLVHGFASWSTLFIFKTTQIIPVVADHIRHSRSFDPHTCQTMLLTSHTSLAISRTIDYHLPHFTTLRKQIIDRVREARARDDTELTRELALAMMEHSHQFISMLFKIGLFRETYDEIQQRNGTKVDVWRTRSIGVHLGEHERFV
ncbi:unnamed protein product, partial [Rhizoctonia solani]